MKLTRTPKVRYSLCRCVLCCQSSFTLFHLLRYLFVSSSVADLSTEPIESSSLEREEKLNAFIDEDRMGKDKEIGERFCGTKDTSNSDGSIFSGANEKDTRGSCRLNVPGKQSRHRVFSIKFALREIDQL